MNGNLKEFYSEAPRPHIILAWLLIFFGLFYMARANFLLFHSATEMFAIAAGLMIYVLASKTYKFSGNYYLLVIGISYLFTSVITFFHLITYYGMGVFPLFGPNISTQLWIASRYVEAVSFFAAPFIARRWIYSGYLIGIYMAVTGVLVTLIMGLKVFPVCFVDNGGLTDFKIISEYAISVLNALTILYLYIHKKDFGSLYVIMSVALVFSILSSISFTLYNDVYGVYNFIGHIFRLIALYIVFQGVVLRGLSDPVNVIFEQLRLSAIVDSLTGLYNRQGFSEISFPVLEKSKLSGNPLAFLMIDLDKFKKVNDKYGHEVGDRVLKNFARLLQSSVGVGNKVFRVGGDEFIALVNGDDLSVEAVCLEIRKKVQDWTSSDETVKELGVSIGWSVWKTGSVNDIDTLIKIADDQMYMEKVSKQYPRS